MSRQTNAVVGPGQVHDDGAKRDEQRMARAERASNPMADALRAEAQAHRALADAKDAQATAIEHECGAPDPDGLVSAKSWPPDLAPLTWRAAFEAARRGELPIVRCGRTPALRRGDVVAWLAARTERRPRVATASSESPSSEYAQIVTSIASRRGSR